jgi:predicted RNA binding protein YcfA (HicA-like mRNA interferase family)
MKRRDLLRHLEAQGCRFVRDGQSHTIYENARTGQRAPVPRHREIPEPLVRVICRQLGVSPP